MSSSFAGSSTKSLSERVEREIETRLKKSNSKRLDAFTEDFNPPGTAEFEPGQNPRKGGGPYEDKHSDFTPEANRSFTLNKKLAAAGPNKNPSMGELDQIDINEQKINSGIKPAKDQFPGKIGPGALNSEIEKRLKRLSAKSDIKGTTTIAVFFGTQLMMGQRKDNGKWTLPGGGMENKESPLAGALRELFEEAGIKPGSLESIGSEIVSGRTGRKVQVHCFKVNVKSKDSSTIYDPDKEVQKWQWIETIGGLPSEILNNLQSPDNLLLKLLGLQ